MAMAVVSMAAATTTQLACRKQVAFGTGASPVQVSFLEVVDVLPHAWEVEVDLNL